MFQCVLKRSVASRFFSLHQGILGQRCNKATAPHWTHVKKMCACKNSLWRLHHRRYLCFSKCNGQIYAKRKYSSAPESWESENISLENRLIERWVYEVDQFGKLHVNIPFDVEISTLNPQEYPVMNKALVTILTKEDGQNDKARSFSDIYDLKIEDNKENKTLSVTSGLADGVILPVICSIKVPLKFDIHVESSQSSDVSIKKTECDNIDVQMMGGECKLKAVKCGRIRVENKGGSISSQSLLQGNIHLKTGGKGKIKGKRLQGIYVTCESEAGSLSVESIYADKSTFSSCHGDIHLGNCHGTTDVKIDTGNLVVDTVDGDLTAEVETGNIDVFIERHQAVQLASQTGNISLRCRDDLQSEVVLVADSLSVENTDFQHTESQQEGQTKYSGFIKSKDERKIHAETKKGSITVSTQSWLSSVGLKFGS